jgi:hypothetical protein
MPELSLQRTFEVIDNSTLRALDPTSVQQLPT